MGYIIKRQDYLHIAKERSWLMLYGRRKTGKTFLLRNLCKFRNYFLVKRNLSIISDKSTDTIKDFVGEVKGLLEKNSPVVIDEFQRLDESVLEDIIQMHPKGRLILSGSSMRIAKKYFSSQSPLLGLFALKKISLISPYDIMHGLHKFSPEKRIEFSAFLREPWLIPFFNNENIADFVYKIIVQSEQVITSLMGEIFSEEERELSKKYAAILSLIGSGIWSTKEITNIMYTRNLIPDPSPTHIVQYLKNLEEMELVESIKLYKSKNRHFYRLKSPIMNIYYYLDDRYNISHRDVSLEEIMPTLQKLLNIEIQNFVADLFAEKLAGRKEYFLSPSREIDFVITKRNKPILAGEVKWKKATPDDASKFKDSSSDFFCRKVFICKSGFKSKEIEIFDADKLCLRE